MAGVETRVAGLDDIDVIAKRLMAEVVIQDRTWLFKTYKRCFLGTDLVKAIVKLQIAPDAKGAVAVGNQLMRNHVFHHVWENGFEFKNSTLFYRFAFHEELLGGEDLTNISLTYVLKTCERMDGNVEMVEYKAGHHAFLGKAVFEWLMKEGTVLTEEEAMRLCNLFVACKLITAVVSKSQISPFSQTALYRMSRCKHKNAAALKAAKSQEKASAPLGVLRLEYGYPPIPGDIDHPNSFPYDVVYRQVPGLTFELAQRGDLPDEVRNSFLTAIADLEKLGVFGITGDCGFMANYQRFVAESTTVAPVFMSSLCLIPSIMAGLKANAKLLVVTANSESLAALFPNVYDAPLDPKDYGKCAVTNDFLMKQCGCSVARPERIINMGLQDLTGFEVVAEATSLLSPEVDRVLVGNEISKRVVDFIARDMAVQAILLECTELPHFSAPLLRNYTGLPVFDALSVCDFFQEAMDQSVAQSGRRAYCVGQHCQRGLPDTVIGL